MRSARSAASAATAGGGAGVGPASAEGKSAATLKSPLGVRRSATHGRRSTRRVITTSRASRGRSATSIRTPASVTIGGASAVGAMRTS
jgi:hypothetical protein